MKILNYDSKTLILQNLRSAPKETPTTFTLTQYKILCNLIRQKHITKKFFEFLLVELYGLTDWKKLNYQEMYQLIHILTYYNYEKENMNHERTT